MEAGQQQTKIHKQNIEKEMQSSYLAYSMSVIVGRALPDVRDGLKPVHRRILFAMQGLGLVHNKSFKKSARVVGEVLGKYHPHGDTAVYDTMVRMAQDFSLRYPLVNGQGNWGNIDGDSAAAMRYTEAKLSKISDELLSDLNKNTVNFQENFDGSEKEPEVLPARLPNLLINGSTGIAVGMATNIPPHNVTEVCNAIIHLLDNPQAEISELMNHISGPDFPTGGIICGRSGILSAYKTGRGKVKLRAKADIEEKNGKETIIVHEIPYMVNKSNLLLSMAHLVNNKVIDGISDIRDESDRDGMRIVIEIKKSCDGNVVLNQLYKHTQLQTTFGVIMLALNNKQPEIMDLRQILDYYILHRKEVVIRRTEFELQKAEARSHILEGLRIALANIDAIVQGIKSSKNVDEARNFLIESYNLSEKQAQAILDMKLQKLTSLETTKLEEEYQDLQTIITDLKDILANDERVRQIIKTDALDMIEKFGDMRKTAIEENHEELDMEDLITEEDVVITMTNSGYVKRMPVTEYKVQKRGGVGIKGANKKEEDAIENIFVCSTHSYILCFSNSGQMYWLKGYQVPEMGRYAKGKAIVNLLNLKEGDRITTIIPVKVFDDEHSLLMATRKGLLKKTNLKAYSRPRIGGIIGINLRDGDQLVSVKLTDGNQNFIIASQSGYAVKFNEQDVRDMGRNSMGVRGIRLREDDNVVGMESADDSKTLLTVTEHGYGKRSAINDYRLINRGGKGVINIKTTDRNGKVVAIKTINGDEDIIAVSENGIVIRMKASGISLIGRNTQGVRVMRLRKGDKVATVAKVLCDDEEHTNEDAVEQEQSNEGNNPSETE
jgi:DNA gyrase subunit A